MRATLGMTGAYLLWASPSSKDLRLMRRRLATWKRRSRELSMVSPDLIVRQVTLEYRDVTHAVLFGESSDILLVTEGGRLLFDPPKSTAAEVARRFLLDRLHEHGAAVRRGAPPCIDPARGRPVRCSPLSCALLLVLLMSPVALAVAVGFGVGWGAFEASIRLRSPLTADERARRVRRVLRDVAAATVIAFLLARIGQLVWHYEAHVQYLAFPAIAIIASEAVAAGVVWTLGRPLYRRWQTAVLGGKGTAS